MKASTKSRLDALLVELNLAPSRQRAQGLIIAGLVEVKGRIIDKAGSLVDSDSPIVIKGNLIPYVSRGGVKLAAGLSHFDIRPQGLVCIDVGASTGGFTDCLLQNGALKVYAIDVGYGQLDWKLRQDPRVVVMERTNARHLKPGDILEPIDLAVVDASFISLKLLLPALLPLFRHAVSILALIKPQFEVGKGRIGKGGVVRDPALHTEVVNDIIQHTKDLALESRGIVPSPILGPKGNQEFLIHLVSDKSSTDRP